MYVFQFTGDAQFGWRKAVFGGFGSRIGVDTTRYGHTFQLFQKIEVKIIPAKLPVGDGFHTRRLQFTDGFGNGRVFNGAQFVGGNLTFFPLQAVFLNGGCP